MLAGDYGINAFMGDCPENVATMNQDVATLIAKKQQQICVVLVVMMPRLRKLYLLDVSRSARVTETWCMAVRSERPIFTANLAVGLGSCFGWSQTRTNCKIHVGGRQPEVRDDVAAR